MSSCRQKISQFLKRIDFYGVKIDLNFQKNSNHRTLYGGLISIVIFVLFALSCASYGSELIQKKKPIVTTSERFVKNPLRMDIDKSQQTLMIGVRNMTGQPFYNPAYFTIYGAIFTMQKYYDQTNNQNVTNFVETELKMRRCTINDNRVEKLKSFFGQIELNDFLCFDDNQEIFIEGDITYDYNTRIEVTLKQCQNSTKPNSIVCATQEQIDSQLSYAHLVTYFIDKIIDPTNLDNPFSYEGSHLHSIVSNKQGKQVTLNFANYYIYSDIGLINEEIEQIKEHRFVTQQETVSFESPQSIVKIVIQCLENKDFVYKRSYMKIQDFVTQIGGVLKLITFIGALITYPFVNFHLNKEIVNNLFDFETEQNQNQNQNYQQQEFLSPINNTNQEQLQIKYYSNEMINLQNNASQLQIIERKLKQRQSSLLNQVTGSQKQIRPLSTKSQRENQNDFQQSQEIAQSQQDKSNFINSSIGNSFPNKQLIQRHVKSQSNSQDVSPIEIELSKNEQINQLINTEELENNYNLIQTMKSTLGKWVLEKLQPLKKIINYNTLEYFAHIIYPFSKQIQKKKPLLDASIDKVNSFLDIEYILKKFQEIDKLKQIVLTEDQIQLFDLLPRPLVQKDNKLNKVNISSTYYNQDSSFENKYNKLYKSIENIINKEKKSEKDLRLMELIDTNLFNIISIQQKIRNYKQKRQSIDQINAYQNDEIMEQASQCNQHLTKNSQNIIQNINTQSHQTHEAEIDYPDESDQITNSPFRISLNYKKNSLFLRDKIN